MGSNFQFCLYCFRIAENHFIGVCQNCEVVCLSQLCRREFSFHISSRCSCHIYEKMSHVFLKSLLYQQKSNMLVFTKFNIYVTEGQEGVKECL